MSRCIPGPLRFTKLMAMVRTAILEQCFSAPRMLARSVMPLQGFVTLSMLPAALLAIHPGFSAPVALLVSLYLFSRPGDKGYF
jgi:hypothetical protein